MEKSPEISGGHNTTFYREQDTRVGRWWSCDTVVQSKQTPYAMMDGNAIVFTDVLGNHTEGDFYSKDGSYLGSDGISDDKVYVVSSVAKNSNNQIISSTDKITLKDADGSDLSYETFKRFAHSTHGEDGKNADARYAMANASYNYINRNSNGKYTTLKNAFAPGAKYSSVPESLKQNFTKGASEESKKTSFAAVINAVTNGFDYSFGAERWDGVDLAEKGSSHNVPLSGVFIAAEHFKAFGAGWSDELIAKNRGHNKNLKHSIWDNSSYQQNGYVQLGTSKYNEDAIRYSSTVVIGQVIFWKPIDLEIGKWMEKNIERPIENYFKSLTK